MEGRVKKPVQNNEDRKIKKFGVSARALRCPLWVISRPFSTAVRMSAFGGKADVNHYASEGPLIAISGHRGDGEATDLHDQVRHALTRQTPYRFRERILVHRCRNYD